MTINSYDATVKKVDNFNLDIVFDEIIFQGRKFTLSRQPTDDKANRLTLFWANSNSSIPQNQSGALKDNIQPFSSESTASMMSLDRIVSPKNKVYKKSHQPSFIKEFKSNRTPSSQSQKNNEASSDLCLPENPSNLINSPPQTAIETDSSVLSSHTEPQNIQKETEEALFPHSDFQDDYTLGLEPLFPEFLTDNYDFPDFQNPCFVPHLSASNLVTLIQPDDCEQQNLQAPVSGQQPAFQLAHEQFGNNIQMPLTAIATNQLQMHNLQNEQDSITKATPKKLGRPPAQKQGYCDNCGTQKTVLDQAAGLPIWRRGPNGPSTLCNSCGLRYTRNQKAAVQANNTPLL